MGENRIFTEPCVDNLNLLSIRLETHEPAGSPLPGAVHMKKTLGWFDPKRQLYWPVNLFEVVENAGCPIELSAIETLAQALQGLAAATFRDIWIEPDQSDPYS